MDVREKYVMQKVSRKEKSICTNCIHHNICIAENNQPCFECNRFIDANGVTVHEWISVTDRLPEDGLPKGSRVKQIKVLTVLKSNNGARTVRSQMRYRMTWYTSEPWAWKCSGSEITHWMPLPEPPKGD